VEKNKFADAGEWDIVGEERRVGDKARGLPARPQQEGQGVGSSDGVLRSEAALF
jgi:hypothetical protein